MKQFTTEALGHGLIALSVSIGASNKMGWFDFINASMDDIDKINASVLYSDFPNKKITPKNIASGKLKLPAMYVDVSA